MNAVVEEVSKQYQVQVPWGGAVMKMLCNNEYKFWRRRWGADAAGSVLLGSSVMCSELFFSEESKEISHLVIQSYLVVTQQQTKPHNNKKRCKKTKTC